VADVANRPFLAYDDAAAITGNPGLRRHLTIAP
jgi:hypothetical protein